MIQHLIKRELIDFEYVSKQPQPYISPIMSMTQDEILDFVEEFEVHSVWQLSACLVSIKSLF